MDRKETIDKIRAIKLGSSRLGEPRSIDIHGNENVTMRFLDIKERDHGADHRDATIDLHRRPSGPQKGKERQAEKVSVTSR